MFEVIHSAELSDPVEEPVREPSIASIVHRHSAVGCQAAIVTRLWPDNSVDLNAFGPFGAEPFVRVPYGSDKGMWHWPGECL